MRKGDEWKWFYDDGEREGRRFSQMVVLVCDGLVSSAAFAALAISVAIRALELELRCHTRILAGCRMGR